MNRSLTLFLATEAALASPFVIVRRRSVAFLADFIHTYTNFHL